MDSLKNIKVIRTMNCLVVMDKDMQDILDRSEVSEKNKTISHSYEGIEFIAMPSGKIYISLEDLQKRPALIK